MKTTLFATALTLIAITTLPVTAQTGRADSSAPGQPTASGTTLATPTDPKALPAPASGTDHPKAAPEDQAKPDPDDPNATADGDATAKQDDEDDPDLDVNLAQPDYTIITLPTSLRLPQGKFAFRVTHRFGRPLDDGNFGDLAADLFGFDAGGLIGLEVRYGVLRGTQVGVLRTSDRTIQIFGQQQVVGQEHFPLGLALNLTIDGTNNFQDSYSPGIGLVVSREIGRVAAVYVEPMWVNNTNTLPSELTDDNSSFLLGVGGRVRVSRRAYLVGEIAPRVNGFDPGSTHASAGIEMRAGGHAFQINFSRGLGTTIGQVARGGTDDDWFIGFNISRKFW